jgi:hypothetical protein
VTAHLDRFGRYLIVPIGGYEPIPHTRATTVAATVEDRHGLERWQLRTVAIGLSRRADYLARVVAARDDDRASLDRAVADALEAGGASTARNFGSASHEVSARVDAGELEVGAVAEPLRGDVEAYRRTLDDAGLVVELVEQTVVIPELVVAGTFDRIVRRGDRRYVLDLKTGRTLDYSWGSIAVQVACYAHASSLYDFDAATHAPMPEVDQLVGIVAHLPAGQGRCTLHAVDLEVGWHGAQLAHAVRAWRGSEFCLTNGMLDVLSDGVTTASTGRREWLVGRVRWLVAEHPDAAADLARRWPPGVPTLKSNGHDANQLEQIARVLRDVEEVHGVPFAHSADPG